MKNPQEEPKPHLFCETPEEKCAMNYCDENGCQNRKRELVEPQEELKQETTLIEEAKKLWDESHPNPIEMALFGAKWQAKQDKNKYSEE